MWTVSGSGSLNPAYPPTCNGSGYAESWRYYQPSAGATMPSTETITVSYCGKSDSIQVTVRPRASGSLSGGGACPGQDANIIARVHNTMGCAETFSWEVQKKAAPDGGEAGVNFTPSSGSTGSVAAQSWSASIPITATVGAGSPPGSVANIELIVTVSNAEATDPDNRPDAVIGVASQNADGSIGNAGGCPGESIEISKTITNRGACPESFDWKIVKTAGDLSFATISGSTPTLQPQPPNNSDSTPANYTIPGTALPGQSATVDLQIKLNGTYVVKDTATIGVPAPSCTATLGSAYGCADSTVEIPINITNDGNCPTTFNWKVEQIPEEDPIITGSVEGSTGQLSPQPPGNTYDTPVEVQIRSDASAGDTATLKLTIWVENSSTCDSYANACRIEEGGLTVLCIQSIELVSGATMIGDGTATPARTDVCASIKDSGNVVLRAQLDPEIPLWEVPEDLITWSAGQEDPEHRLQRLIPTDAWTKHTVTATCGNCDYTMLVYIIGAEQTAYSPSNGTSGSHFADNSKGFPSTGTGIFGPDPSLGSAPSRCEIQFTAKPDVLVTDGNANLFDKNDIQWDVSRDKKKKKWTKTAGTWSLVVDQSATWVSDDAWDGEEDNDPWDSSGHLYGNDAPGTVPGPVDACVRKMNLREWVRVGLGGTTGRNGSRCSEDYEWHVFRSIKKNGTWADDNTYGNGIPPGNVFWGTVPIP